METKEKDEENKLEIKECPKCGKPCSWILEKEGSIFCVHYEGYEKDPQTGKIKKKQQLHYIGRKGYITGQLNTKPFAINNARVGRIEKQIKELEKQLQQEQDESKKQELEKKIEELKMKKESLEKKREALKNEIIEVNIHLLSYKDKERFFKYIKESLEYLEIQPDFSDEEKIMRVLDMIEDFLESFDEIPYEAVEKLDRIKAQLLYKAKM